MQVGAPTFVVDVQAIQHLPESGLRVAMEPRTVLQHLLECPARTIYADLMGITTHHMQQRFFGGCVVWVHRGKKQSCALILREPANLPVPTFGSA